MILLYNYAMFKKIISIRSWEAFENPLGALKVSIVVDFSLGIPKVGLF